MGSGETSGGFEGFESSSGGVEGASGRSEGVESGSGSVSEGSRESGDSGSVMEER
jgi:hypothetical protein